MGGGKGKTWKGAKIRVMRVGEKLKWEGKLPLNFVLDSEKCQYGLNSLTTLIHSILCDDES